MRLVTYTASAGPRAGVLNDAGVIDAWEVLGQPQRSSLRELIAEDRIAELSAPESDPTPRF